MKSLVERIEAKVPDPKKGLPEEIFYLVGRLTPFVNIDLLIRHQKKGVLLTWRDDQYSGSGWHFPGGIIRYKENAENRVHEVARLELGILLDGIKALIDVNQIIAHAQRDRAHFISLLYECQVGSDQLMSIIETNKIHFFKNCPQKLLSRHSMYAKHFF